MWRPNRTASSGLGRPKKKQALTIASTLRPGIASWLILLKMIPGMTDAELLQQTACLRPLSADGLPIVDKVTGWENLYVSTGAGRKGILWSTGMAHALFEMIDEGAVDVIGAEHLKLDRFPSEGLAPVLAGD